MEAHYTTPLGPFAPALGVVSVAGTTRQELTPLPAPILGANEARLGSFLKIEAEGQWSATATPTLILELIAGVPGASGGGTATSILAASAAQTLSATTDIPWRIEWRGKFVTLGTTGSIVGTGSLALGTSLTAVTSVSMPITLALRTVAINTTVANAIGVWSTYGTSNAANVARCYSLSALLQN